MNLLDKLIGYVSPRAAFERARFRAATRGYEGATKGRRLKGWNPSGADVNSDTRMDLTTLRNRHRDMVKNNPWCKRAVNAIVNNTVGTGIIGEVKSPNKKKSPRLNAEWKRFSCSTACDIAGDLSFDAIQNLAIRTCVDSGEALIRRYKSGPFGLQLQVLEPDHIDSERNEQLAGGGQIVQGVQYDASGKRVGFWLFPRHPGAAMDYRAYKSTLVPADDVIHMRQILRPGQVRGIPWGVSGMLTIKDHDGYEDAYLVRQKVAACFAGFVYDTEAQGVAQGSDPPAEKIEPGAIEVLPPGKSIEFPTMPSVDGYGNYTRAVLHRIAAAFDLPPFVLTGDLSEVNYSSGRLGWLEFQRSIEAWRWHMIVPQFLSRVGQWFLETAPIHVGDGMIDGAWIDWTPPRREMLAPEKEIPALIEAARAAILSMPEIHRQTGYDSAQVISEVAEFNKMADEAGLKLDSDGRNARQGAQSTPQEGQGSGQQAAKKGAEPDAMREFAQAMGVTMERAMSGVAEAVRGIKAPDVKVDLNPQFQLDLRPRAMKRTVTAVDADGVATEITETPVEDA